MKSCDMPIAAALCTVHIGFAVLGLKSRLGAASETYGRLPQKLFPLRTQLIPEGPACFEGVRNFYPVRVVLLRYKLH